ncbi:MAG: hypothetical protein ACP5VE_10655 [Chthonomonadales bacterium]
MRERAKELVPPDAHADEYVERDCLLFEAGSYPDRGLEVTLQDLEAIARNTPAEVPVKIEHLGQSPFDAAMGTVGRLRVVGRRLWGTLRQPAATWRFIQQAGAKALSIALDVASKRIVETSFVCRPRVPTAQVFGGGTLVFTSYDLLTHTSPELPAGEKEVPAVTVRQLADSLVQYLRGVASTQEDARPEQFASERAELEKERAQLLHERAQHQIRELKQRGLIRAGGNAELLAAALLTVATPHTVAFGSEHVSIPDLFLRFLKENGPIVPMGEWMPAGSSEEGAAQKLIALAQDTARKENLGYVAAFARVSAQHPDLARAAREEAFKK